MARMLFLTSVLFLTGCAVQEQHYVACTSLECMNAQAADQVRRQCVADLQRYNRYSRARQRQIQKTYQYPLTDADSYAMWVRLGGDGPSPWAWCGRYAQAVTVSPVLLTRH